jgi:hypothetical protein
MRHRPVRAATVAATVAVLAFVACRDSVVGPYTPSGAPPSGLTVSLSERRLDPDGPIPTSTTFTAAGDSVVVTATLANDCVRWSPHAGVADGALIITVADSMPPGGRNCFAVASLGSYQAVVRPAPPGTYAVVLRSRVIASNRQASEVERGRARVTVR